MALLAPLEAAAAWHKLAEQIEDMEDMDVPKFRDLLQAIRHATIAGKQAK